MTSGMTSGYLTRRTITAFFDTRSDAEEAVSRLQTADIAPESIRLIPGTERDMDAPSSDVGTGLLDSLRDLFLPDEIATPTPRAFAGAAISCR